MQARLIPHPGSNPAGIRSVEISLTWVDPNSLFLTYSVEPAYSVRLPDHGGGRKDGLWRHTCFELFLKSVGGGYREFNFAPTSAWNAYAFSDWRRGMKNLDVQEPPHLVDSRLDGRRPRFPERYELDVVLSPELVSSATKLSLTAVIEEKSGTKSYWALAHPPEGPPDFHHPACFVLELPPAPRA